MSLHSKKIKIIIIFVFLVTLLVINELTSYYSPSISVDNLETIKSFDWSMNNLNENGFQIDGLKAFLTIYDDEGSVCRITVSQNYSIDKKMIEYNGMQYSARKIHFGIFDIRRYLDSNYITDYYTFICDDACIKVSEHTFVQSKHFFFELINQINNGGEKIEMYQAGLAKYKE